MNTGGSVLAIDRASGRVSSRLEIEGGHVGAELGRDDRWLYLAKTIDGTGGAITVVALEPMRVHGSIHLDDISPWAIAVRPVEGGVK